MESGRRFGRCIPGRRGPGYFGLILDRLHSRELLHCHVSIQRDVTGYRSAPFVDYANDVIYVGDSVGSLHKFTGVFNGTPAEVTAGWPIVVNSTHALTSPVYDSASGNIFVGDSAGRLSYVRDTNSTVGTCASGSPPCLGATTQQVGTAGAIVDGPDFGQHLWICVRRERDRYLAPRNHFAGQHRSDKRGGSSPSVEQAPEAHYITAPLTRRTSTVHRGMSLVSCTFAVKTRPNQQTSHLSAQLYFCGCFE